MKEISKKMKPVEKARDCCPLPCLQPTREFPIWHKVRSRHLELEPLCSLSSCVIRGGCVTIVACELLFVFCTSALSLTKVYNDGNPVFWRNFHWNLNSVVTHPLFLYVLFVFNAITTLMAFALAKAILRFERLYAKLHWQFDFFALGFYVCAFVLYVVALSSNGPESWSLVNIGLTVCFALQIPVQLWAIAIVRDCFHFFNLLHVLIVIAE